MKGSERDVGHVYSEQLDIRMAEVRRNPVPTPWNLINGILKGGGVSGGELCVLCAATSVGKSHALVDIGAGAIQRGYNVVHYTFELSEVDVGNRYDANISGIAPEHLRTHRNEVEEAIDEKVNGHLIIKSYPTKSASVLTIKNHLHKLAMRDIRPDLLVVDYGDLMKSLKSYEHKRFEEERIYEDLRGLAGEFNIPIWTATQTNREALDADVVTLKHIAECFAKAMVSDLFITMNRKKDGQNSTIGNFFVAKSRLGTDGIKFPTLFNTSLSKFDVRAPGSVDDTETHSERLRKKFLNMNKKK
jgi:replicative DNA helicase